MKTLVQQIQEIMECAGEHVQVVEVRPVSSATEDQGELRKEQADSVTISGRHTRIELEQAARR